MEKDMLGNKFRYEDGLLYKKKKNSKTKWSCCNDLKPCVLGYIPVGVDRKFMKLHRLVYLFHNPDWDIHDNSRDNSIDHINEDKKDNRIENLRIVNNSQNKQNTEYYGGHKIKGVTFRGERAKPYRAYWNENGKQKSRYFETEAEALEYRAEMVELVYSHHHSKRNQ
jgi:hypothetical protein